MSESSCCLAPVHPLHTVEQFQAGGAEMEATRSARGKDERFSSAAHPQLRTAVVEYWGLARDLGAMRGFTITPDCYGELICCVDDLYVSDGGEREKLPKFFLVGLLEKPLRIVAEGVVRCMAARLRPWALGVFIPTCPHLDRAGWADAAPFFGPHRDLVTEGVSRCDWTALCSILDLVLIEQLSQWSLGEQHIASVRPFVETEHLSTTTVASELNLTRRQIERRVRRLTGTSPRQLACLARFQKVRDAIWADPSIDLARLAVEAGYSDQPHMTRAFGRYSGQTPTQFARESKSKRKWLEGRDVAFVQEGPAAGS